MIWFIVVWILPVGAPRAPWTFEEKEKKKAAFVFLVCAPCPCAFSVLLPLLATHCCQAREPQPQLGLRAGTLQGECQVTTAGSVGDPQLSLLIP